MRPHSNRPRYKGCKVLKEDIWGKLTENKFKKEKWKDIFFSINKQRKHDYVKVWDFKRQRLKPFLTYLRFQHQNNLARSIQWRKFYGSDQHFKIRKLARSSKNWKDFLHKLEMRLEVIVYRCHLATSVTESRHLIKRGFVSVSGSISSPKLLIKPGHIVSWRKGFRKFVRYRLESTENGFIPGFVDIEPQSLDIWVKSQKWNHCIYYPFSAEPQTVLEFYKKVLEEELSENDATVACLFWG